MDVLVYTVANVATVRVASNQGVSAKVADYARRFPGEAHHVRYACSDAGTIEVGCDAGEGGREAVGVAAGGGVVAPPVVFEQLTYFFDVDFAEGLAGLDESSIRVRHYLAEFTDSFIRRGHSIRGQFSFVNEPGRFRFEVVFKVGAVERSLWIEFTVASTKMDVTGDYREILRAVESWGRGLVFVSKAKTLHEVRRIGEKAPADGQKDWVVYFERALDVYERALRRILHEPNRRMVTRAFHRRVDQVRRWTPAMAREYARLAEDAERLERRRLVDAVREMTFDTRENRFVKHTLRRLTACLQVAQREFAGDGEYSDVFKEGLARRIDRFRRYLRDPKLAAVEDGHAESVNSLVMQMRPGYSDVRVVWTLMNGLFTSDISLSARRNPSVGFAKLSALYEFWCFLTVKGLMDAILLERFGAVPRQLGGGDAKKAIAAATAGEDEDKTDDAPVAYAYEAAGVTVAKVAFQQSYGPAKEGAKGANGSDVFAAPFRQRPDIVVSLRDRAHVYTYLFDAKYRIENSELTGGRDAAPRDALDQMHRYRDAILWRTRGVGEDIKREVVGAYILYPADESEKAVVPAYSYDELIATQNVGAFALLPGRVERLRAFLTALVGKLDVTAETSAWLLKERQVIPQKGLFYTDDADDILAEATTLDVEVEERQYAAFARNDCLRFFVRADVLAESGKSAEAIRRLRVHVAGEAARILEVAFVGVKSGESYAGRGGRFADARHYPWAKLYFQGLMVEYTLGTKNAAHPNPIL